jgi:hypothetical protein
MCRGLSRAVLGVYARVLLDVYARGARERGIDGGQTGMVTALQRAGGALNANLYFHTLALDGVFIEEPGGALAFHPTPAPRPPDPLRAPGSKVVNRWQSRRSAPTPTAIRGPVRRSSAGEPLTAPTRVSPTPTTE